MGRVVETGRTLNGRYQLAVRLGRGGFGEVWRARDVVLGRDVAIKLLAPVVAGDPAVRRFEREARIVAGLDHPNVVAVYDWARDGDSRFVVMQLLSGPSLGALLRERGPLEVRDAVAYAGQAAAGLAAVHRAGVVHRDVTPDNLILDAGSVKLVDFGIARLLDGSTGLTVAGTLLATPGYVSPEQAAGHPAGAQSDLYALGCVLYALLTGEPPFRAEHPMAVVRQHVASPAPRVSARRSDVPAELDGLVAALLAKDPADRPGGADEVRRRLLAAVDGDDGWEMRTATMPVVTGPTRVLPAAGRTAPRGRAARVPAVVGLAIVAAIAAAAIAARPGGSTKGAAPDPSTPAASAPTGAATPAARTSVPAAAVAPPDSPGRAFATLARAVSSAQERGWLDPVAAAALDDRLSRIGRALAGSTERAASAVDDLRRELGDLAGAGLVTAAGVRSITVALDRLAALLPPPAPQAKRGHGKGRGGGHDKGN